MAQLIAVNAVHAGSGVSTTVANVAALLATSTPGRRVGVVDACLSAPTQHLLFGLRQAAFRFTLNDVLAGRCRLADAAHDLPVAANPDDPRTVLLVPADPDPSAVKAADHHTHSVGSLGQSCQQLAAQCNLDVVLIDTDAGLPPSSLACLAAAQTALLVLTLDKQQYQGAARTASVVEHLAVMQRRLMVNLASPSLDPTQVQTQVAQSFGWEVAGITPYCDELMALGSASLFVVRYPVHPVTTIFRHIAQQLVNTL